MGHLDLLWFHVTQMCVGVHSHPSASATIRDFLVCARLCLYNISSQMFPMAFRFTRVVTMNETLNWVMLCDLDPIFKVTWGHYVSNELCLCDISSSFVLMAFKLRQLVSIYKTLNWLICHDLASIFKITGGSYVSKLFILFCNLKAIEARTFAGHTVLSYFLVLLKLFVAILFLLLIKHILYYHSKTIEEWTSA